MLLSSVRQTEGGFGNFPCENLKIKLLKFTKLLKASKRILTKMPKLFEI